LNGLTTVALTGVTKAEFTGLSGTQMESFTQAQANALSDDIKGYVYDKGYALVTNAGITNAKGIYTDVSAISIANTSATTIIAGKKAASITSATGATAADTIYGSPAADTITASGGGADSIDAGAGNDGITVDSDTEFLAFASIDGGDGKDTLTITAPGTTIDDTVVATSFAHVANVEVLVLGASATLTLGTEFATAGITSITGSGGVDALTFAEQGSDVSVNGGVGADTIQLGNYANTLTVADTDGIAITGGSAVDTITMTTALTATTIDGAGGNDEIILKGGVANTATVKGGSGQDTINLGSSHSGKVTIDLTTTTVANADTISNFIHGVDMVLLKGSASTRLTASAGLSVAGVQALAASNTAILVIVDTAAKLGTNGATIGDVSTNAANAKYAVASDTGAIYYDSNADWSDGGAVQIGTVGVVTGLDVTDFSLTP